MEKNAIFCIIATVIKIITCQENEEIQTSKFPDMFYMDDYYECIKQKENGYCTANMRLIPKDANSGLWKEIETVSLHRLRLDHTIIHRTMCVPSKYKDYLEKKTFFEIEVNQELKGYNLNATMFSMDCKKEYADETETSKTLIGMAIYMGFVLLATIWSELCDKSIKQSTISKWFCCFSMTLNWKKLTSNKNPDYEKLKCIQGIRTYQTCLVIACHVLLAFAQLSWKTPFLIEELFKIRLTRILLIFFLYVIQTYFVISSWLLTNQVLELHKKNGRFSIRDALVLFLHRVTRFWAPLLVMRYVQYQSTISDENGPGNFGIINILARTCSKNWWFTFFQLTNWLPIDEVCNLGMWSLSIDTQCYIVNIVVLYVALNYKLDFKKCMAYMFIVNYIVNLTTFFHYEIPLFGEMDIKHIKRIDFYQESRFSMTYVSFWINAGSSLIGSMFGYFYFLRKHNVKIEAIEKLCGPIFAVIPVVAVLSADLDPGKVVSILVGPLLKPLYGFGIACGIYGMTRNVIQGWTKSICENRYAILLANFTFSTYIYHIFIVFAREAPNTTLIHLRVEDMVLGSVIDILHAFAVGILGALVVEQPGINIKNMILPRIKRKDEDDEKQSNGFYDKNK